MNNDSNKIKALATIEENMAITVCANGYWLEVNGKTAQDEWLAVKYVVKTFDELIDLVTEIDQRCRQDRGF